MEDPTGGMWIYLIFLAIPLARILPRMLRKYRRKNAGLEPEPDEKYPGGQFFTRERRSELPKYEEEPPKYEEEPPKYEEEPPEKPQPKSDNSGGWMKKDDFK
tara:strand:+ start:387 stop:692 length:306 start_codon:yes stop_codon:yes gene_type:complete